MKKLIIGLAVVVLALGIGASVFAIRFKRMVNVIKAEDAKVRPIDMKNIADGVYTGSFGDFLVYATTDVTVKDHRIVAVNVRDQKSGGPKYDAHEVVNRIISEQSPKVDAVTGATGSSKCITIAVYKALSAK